MSTHDNIFLWYGLPSFGDKVLMFLQIQTINPEENYLTVITDFYFYYTYNYIFRKLEVSLWWE